MRSTPAWWWRRSKPRFRTCSVLVTVNERRLAAGDIAQVDFLQSRVEAQQFQADVMAAQGELRAAEVAMAELLGPEVEPAFDVVGDLNPHRPR